MHRLPEAELQRIPWTAALDRLTSVTYPDLVTDTYTYDALGNRLTRNATAYTYDDADQMLTAGATSYGYDANGNQTSRGADTFTWDHENRLTQAVVGGATSSSAYNGDGVRVSHTVGGSTTNYVADVASALPLALQDGTHTYVYGLDLISATDASGNQTYFSYDGLGSTTDLTNGTGAVTDTYTYDLFGPIRSQTGTTTNVWRFTGEQEDGGAGDTGYYFLRARYLNPESGRFISRDPLAFPQRYAYVGGNPVTYVDPLGLRGWRDPWDCAVDAATWSGAKAVGAMKDAGAAVKDSYFQMAEDFGYVDLNGSGYAFSRCLTTGVQASLADGFHPYLGTRAGEGFGVSLTYGPAQRITRGWACGAQVSVPLSPFLVGVAGQIGGTVLSASEGRIPVGPVSVEPFAEAGVSIGEGAFVTCYRVF